MTPDQWEEALLEFVHRPNYKPVKPRVIAKNLSISADELPDFKRLVKKFVKRGLLVYGANHLLRPGTTDARAVGRPAQSSASPSPAATIDPSASESPQKKEPKGKAAAKHQGLHITGVFRRAQGGFGFVRPQGAAPSHTREQDFYIAADNARDAASGDLVLVRPMKEKGTFRNPRGEIVEILERETHQFVGSYFESGGAAYVQVDGTLFARPIAVGDPGAKNAQPDDKVVFEMVRFPSHAHDGEGVIIEVLGPRGSPGVDTLSIIREYALPEDFAEDAMEAARVEADRFDESIPPSRVDLTAQTTITIDPIDARDFDDAISLRRLENGHWLLGVHIADVSHFVRPGNPLDREAHNRGTSVYLPDRVIPMLPEIISNSLASLQPDRVRYTKTAELEFTADGIRVGVDLKSTAIRSQRRFAYEEVDDYLADAEAWRSKLSPEVHGLVGRMHELAMILRARRIKRGALELSMQEVKVDLDKQGRVVGAHRVVNTVSHQIIEEFMLAANDAVAETLHEAGLLFLRRVHQAPNPLKLKALTEFVTELGFQTPSLESRFAIQALLAEVAGQPAQQAVNYAVLRSLQRAVYSPVEEGHYALSSDCYCHFTSPIRRYPDLTIHRLIEGLLTKRKPRNDETELVVLGEHCSDRERRAEAAERELTKIKLLQYLESRIGDELDAVITGVEEFGIFVQGVELPAEGLVHITSLIDDNYHFDKTTHSLAGRRSGNSYRLGDKIRVMVARVAVDRRELDFRLVRPGTADSASKPAERQPAARVRKDYRALLAGKKPPKHEKRAKKHRG
jgi:ribonuclease R